MALSVPIPQSTSMTIIVIRSINENRKVFRIKLNVAEQSPLSDITPRLIEILQLPTKSKFLYAIVEKNRISQRLSSDSLCSDALRKDCLFAYEITFPEGADDKNCYCLEVQFEYTPKSYIWKVRNPLGFPIIFPVLLTSSVLDVWYQILQYMRPFMKEFKGMKGKEDFKAFYQNYFERKEGPFTLEIFNNRPWKTSYYTFTKAYAPCEFCNGNPHGGNCLFVFKDEEKSRLTIL